MVLKELHHGLTELHVNDARRGAFDTDETPHLVISVDHFFHTDDVAVESDRLVHVLDTETNVVDVRKHQNLRLVMTNDWLNPCKSRR